jgi:hypothetical protein
MSAPEVRVCHWMPAKAERGPRIGFVDVLVPGWGVIIHDMRVLRSDGVIWCERNGRNVARHGEAPMFRPILSFTTSDAWKAFQSAVLAGLLAVHPEIAAPDGVTASNAPSTDAQRTAA